MDVYYRLDSRRKSHLLSIPVEGNLYYPSVIHCGTQSYEGRGELSSRAHEHKVIHLLLFTRGYNEFIFDGKRTPCTRGLLLVCSPGNRHNFFPVHEGSIEYSEITLEYISREKRLDYAFHTILSLLFHTDLNQKDFFMIDEEGIGTFISLHRKLYSCLMKGDDRERVFEADLLLLDIFCFLNDVMGQESLLTRERGKTDWPVRLRDIIHNRFPARLNLEDISRELGVSKSYLIRKFREKFGQTPLDYDRRLRINTAADLITTTNRTLEDIALSLGFCDVFYFIKTFKKYKGVTPGKYR